MTKEQTIKFIKKQLERIKNVYQAQYPEGGYLAMYIVDGNISFNNEYWDKDKEFSIDTWYGEGDEHYER